MVALLCHHILALMQSEHLPVLVLMAPIYLKELALAIVSPSKSIATFVFSYPTTVRLVFRAFDFSSLTSKHELPYIVYLGLTINRKTTV